MALTLPILSRMQNQEITHQSLSNKPILQDLNGFYGMLKINFPRSERRNGPIKGSGPHSLKKIKKPVNPFTNRSQIKPKKKVEKEREREEWREFRGETQIHAATDSPHAAAIALLLIHTPPHPLAPPANVFQINKHTQKEIPKGSEKKKKKALFVFCNREN